MDLLSILKHSLKVEDIENGDYVYCLLDNEEVVYVGRSTKKYASLNNHKTKTFTHLSVFTCNDIGFQGSSEELFFALIFKYVPKYNDTLPKNSRYMSKGMMKVAFNVTGFEINKWIRKNKAHPIYLDYYDVEEVFRDKEIEEQKY